MTGKPDEELIAEVLAGQTDSFSELAGRHRQRVERLCRRFFSDEEMARERTLQLDDLHAREDNPAGVAFLLFAETMYRRHPYRLDTLGTAASVSTMTPGRLAAYRSERYPVGQATLSVVGDVDPDRVSQLIRGRLGKLPHRPAPRLAPPQEEPITAPRAAVRKLDKARALGVQILTEEKFLEMLAQKK